jgi:hypothetical protein
MGYAPAAEGWDGVTLALIEGEGRAFQFVRRAIETRQLQLSVVMEI